MVAQTTYTDFRREPEANSYLLNRLCLPRTDKDRAGIVGTALGFRGFGLVENGWILLVFCEK